MYMCIHIYIHTHISIYTHIFPQAETEIHIKDPAMLRGKILVVS